MRSILFALLLTLSFDTQALTLTSLNIEWFGRGGSIRGELSDEYRTPRLRDFLLNQIPPSDIYIFQEITAPHLLAATLSELTCHDYETSSERHQFVVICHRPELEVNVWQITQVQLENPQLRPAQVASLSLHGQRIDIVGVHLKAGSHSADLRLAQMRELMQCGQLASQAIVIGDFNTFPKADEALTQQLLLNHYQELTNPLPTYLGRNERTFDRAWMKGLAAGELQVFGPCRAGSVARPYSEYDFYQRFISDHCAIQVRFDLKDKP